MVLNKQDEEMLDEFLIVNETLKKLEKDKKRLTEGIKTMFEKYGIDDPLEYNGSKFTVTESVRKTLSKNKKDEFAKELINQGKNYLVLTDVTVDTETVYQEVQNGQLSEDFVKKYMSITPVKTLTCS